MIKSQRVFDNDYETQILYCHEGLKSLHRLFLRRPLREERYSSVLTTANQKSSTSRTNSMNSVVSTGF